MIKGSEAVLIHRCKCAYSTLFDLSYFPGARGKSLQYGFSNELLKDCRNLNLISGLTTDNYYQFLRCIHYPITFTQVSNPSLNIGVYNCLVNTIPEYRSTVQSIDELRALSFDTELGTMRYKEQSTGCFLCPRVRHFIFFYTRRMNPAMFTCV